MSWCVSRDFRRGTETRTDKTYKNGVEKEVNQFFSTEVLNTVVDEVL